METKKKFWKEWQNTLDKDVWKILIGSPVILLIILIFLSNTSFATFGQYNSDGSARSLTYLPTEVIAIPLLLITMFLSSLLLTKINLKNISPPKPEGMGIQNAGFI